MKRSALIISIIIGIYLIQTAGLNGDNGPDHIAPDFIPSFYDHYTINFLNARTLGMGTTTVALQGGIENALANPAAFKGEGFKLYFEGHVKAAVDEMNLYAAFIEDPEEAGSYLDEYELVGEKQKLEQGIPAGMFGFGFSPHHNISLGASISIPQTVRYNLLGRALPTGAYIDRFPSMNNYQTTFTMTGHFDQLNIGLNVIYNYYTFNELRLIAPHFDRIKFQQGVLRFQPGVLYANDLLAFGVSYKFAAEEEIKMGNTEPYYYIYDTHFPALLEAGLSYKYSDDITIALAFEYEQTSNQYELFDDRLKMKIGFEKKFENYDIRGGLISIPGVYTGTFAIPEDTITEGDFIFDPLPYDLGIVEKADQLVITGGFSYYMRDIDLNMAFAKDVLQNFDLFQVVASVNVRLGEVIARGR
ncbi:MAG: hypothetical protein K0B81_01450 [Candidatus Cloacimonetes bacterium]|nr:hypothetical protein [Candidatus Cloacimonadota bacterium]